MAEDKSTVLGIRLDAEERKRFDDFVSEEGKNNKSFLDTLLDLYELNKGKVKNINLVGDIETLEGYTNKIHQAFINVIDKLESQKGYISEISEKNLQIYKDKVNNSENGISILKTENSTVNKKLTNVNNVNKKLEEQNNQLQGSLQDKTLIVAEYKGKNDMLLSQMKQYEKYPDQLETTKGLLTDAQSKNIDLSNNIKNMDFTINNLKESAESQKIISTKAIGALTVIHKNEIEALNNKAEFEKQNSLLVLKQQQQEQIQKLQSELTNKINDYQTKYKALLEQMEKERTIHAATIPIEKNNTIVHTK